MPIQALPTDRLPSNPTAGFVLRLAGALILALLASGCSSLPVRGHPTTELACVRVTYHPAHSPVRLPVSNEELTVLSLEIEGGRATERFERAADGRWTRYLVPDGPVLTLRCCYRAIHGPDGPSNPRALFVGATEITPLPPPPSRLEWP